MITFSRLGSFGRLGNQLFQISAAIGLANINGDAAKFYNWEYSRYFKNPLNFGLSQSEIREIYQEKGFHYTEIPYKNGLDLIGYFQSEKYFKDSEDLIRYHLEFRDDLLTSEEISQTENSCAIHVRRTDYLKFQDYHPVQDLEYYNAGIQYMRDKGINDFIIFSDDIQWCKENFGICFKYSENKSDIKDLALMTKCKSFIIANSSFSWWGAWLNKNPDKKVISPNRWFGPAKSDVITEDIYCSDWIKF
jgi:hypothetical protein